MTITSWTHNVIKPARIGLFFIGLVLFVLLGAVIDVGANGPWSDGQAATLVLGQVDFTHNSFDTSAAKLSSPADMTVDPTTGKVFIADSFNNRVLRFASGETLTTGASAEAVLGQNDFNESATGLSARSMNSPQGVFVDSAGRLWVADTGNNRVLCFDDASRIENGSPADLVLGQPDFTNGSENSPSLSTMVAPRALIIDSAGRLWVAVQGQHRVLRFDQAAAKGNGAEADGVLGQPSPTSMVTATTQTGMFNPSGVAVSASGSLFVADSANNRVLIFDNAAAKATGAGADRVLGQTTFTSRTGATSQNGMRMPSGVDVDLEGRLYVADKNNNRVLIFNNAATLKNGANADHELGQVDFNANKGNRGFSAPGAATLFGPVEIFADSLTNVTWVADMLNQRVLRYAPPPVDTMTTLDSALNPSKFGQGVELTIKVTQLSGSALPTGKVNIKDGAVDLPGCLSLELNAQGQAICSISDLSAGSHDLSAVYIGNSRFNPSTSNLLNQVVVALVPGFVSQPVPDSPIDLGCAQIGLPVTTGLTVSENGNTTLLVTSHELNGPNAADFAVTPGMLAIQDGGAPQELIIQCIPKAPGARIATLSVHHNAAGSPANYPLRCVGLVNVYLPLAIKDP